MLIIILIILAICLISFLLHRKKIHVGSLNMITGGLKTGKTEFAVFQCWIAYKKAIRQWKAACRKAQRRFEPLPEKPLLYSNMPLKMEYAPLTEDLITRKARFAYGSVIYFNEVSLIASSQDWQDNDLNDTYTQFWKLLAHELKAPSGCAWCDTQAGLTDVHYSLKRSLSTQYHIIRNIKLPFFDLLIMREQQVVDGDHTVAMDTQIDPQDTVAEGGKKNYWYLVPHFVWNLYDRYAYSSLTDDLPVNKDTVCPETADDLKVGKKLLRTRTILQNLKKKSKKEGI